MTREPLRAPVSVRGLTPTHRPVPANLFSGRYGDSYLLRLEVAQVEDIAPHVRSLTVASTDLLGFNFTAGQDLMLDFPQAGRMLRRRYTIRRADPDAGTADLEFEIHDGGGVATCWAADADVGSRLEAIGPRGVITVRPDSESHIFVTDDSAMPATFAMIEALQPGATATAFLVSPHGPESRPVPLATADTRIRWVEETRLPEAIRESALPRGVAAYALGERRLVLSAVDLFVRVGVDRDAIASKAYWRRDQPNEARGEPARD